MKMVIMKGCVINLTAAELSKEINITERRLQRHWRDVVASLSKVGIYIFREEQKTNGKKEYSYSIRYKGESVPRN